MSYYSTGSQGPDGLLSPLPQYNSLSGLDGGPPLSTREEKMNTPLYSFFFNLPKMGFKILPPFYRYGN